MCRFLNADGIVQTGQGMLDKNMFAYCMNNPVNLIDPSGKCPYDGTMGDFRRLEQGLPPLRCTCGEKSNSNIITEVIKGTVGGYADSEVGDAIVRATLKEKPVPVRKFIGALGGSIKIFQQQSSKALSFLKGVQKYAGGVVGAAMYVWDIANDFSTYGGFSGDFAKAAMVTTAGAAICVGVGALCTGFGAPVGVAIIAGAFSGAITSYYGDKIKRDLITN